MFRKKGIWAPTELKKIGQSLLGVSENTVFCAPLWDYKGNDIIIYAYWREGCSSPAQMEKLIATEGEKFFSLAHDSRVESATKFIQKHMLASLSEPLVGNSPAFLNVVEHII